MSEQRFHTVTASVHFYAGWPGKSLCGWGNFQEVGPVTTIRSDDVTCERCKALLTPAPQSDELVSENTGKQA
jgi:hypothetical protein